MLKLLALIITGVIVSFYYFPFFTTLLPSGVNTKMLLAILGLLFFGYNFVKQRYMVIGKSAIVLTSYAIIVSIIAKISITINNTPDDSYTTYFISMWVWLSAAYAVCYIIKSIHGELSVDIITNYLIAVCVFQCCAALIIDASPAVKMFVNSFVLQGQEFLDKSDVQRLYGVGANLDTAGIRYSLVLVLLAHSMIYRSNKSAYGLYIKILSYIIIIVVGNMMSRTTTVGAIISLLYLIYGTKLYQRNIEKEHLVVWRSLIIFSIFTIPLIVMKYNADVDFANKIRFAFEGFFSMVESGEWQVGSNDQLKGMLIFPSQLSTWVIGDGYFANPKDIDPYYVGHLTGGFYMNTDSGYSRFIFYFGMFGLIAFALFIGVSANLCIKQFPKAKVLFVLLALVNYVVWIKVATDCFLMFALFIAAGYFNETQQSHENNILHCRNI